jgi:putative flippase GtrA
VRSGAFSSTTLCVEAKRLIRYFGVGGAAAVVDIGLFTLFAVALGLPYLRVSAASFIIATLVNYFLSVRFVFVSGRRYSPRWEIVLVYVVSAIGLLINQAVLAAAVEVVQSSMIVGKVAATSTVFFWNYLARRLVIFGAMHE